MANKRKANSGQILHIDLLPEWFDENGFLTGALEVFGNEQTRPAKGTVLMGTYMLPWGDPNQSFPISGTCEADKALWVDSVTPPHLKMMSVQITERDVIQQTYFNLWGNNVVDVEDLFPAVAVISQERIDVRIVPSHVALDKTTFRHSVELWSRYYVNGQLQWRMDRTTSMRPFNAENTKYAPSHLLRYMHTLGWEMCLNVLNVIGLSEEASSRSKGKYSPELIEYANYLRLMAGRLDSKKHTGKVYSPAGIFVTEEMGTQYPFHLAIIRKAAEELRTGKLTHVEQLKPLEQILVELIVQYDTMRGVPANLPFTHISS